MIMFGPPGSGKGTYASRLSREINIPHISTGDIIREEIKNNTEIGKKIEDYTKRGQLVLMTQLSKFYKRGSHSLIAGQVSFWTDFHGLYRRLKPSKTQSNRTS